MSCSGKRAPGRGKGPMVPTLPTQGPPHPACRDPRDARGDPPPAIPKPPTALCHKSGALQGLLGAVAGIRRAFTEPERVRTTNSFLLSWLGSHRLFSPRPSACSRVLLPLTRRAPRSQPADLLLFLPPLRCPLVLVALAFKPGEGPAPGWPCPLEQAFNV